VRFSYIFTLQDEVEPDGLGVATAINGKWLTITYENPTIYFYDKDVLIIESGGMTPIN
jgi:hypothetical protein